MRRIEEEDIKNVIFLTGDRHHTELSHYVNGAGNDVYDWTVSPLTSGPNTNVTETNRMRVDGTLVQERNFGIMEVFGPRTERKLRMTVYDVEGTQLWSREIASQQ